ncbi:uncharacterized protein LOC131886882 [Tigriopus californicus]|uniref:uncharacterized protein LOC131886882 n=1 Tax=Tigriopus californicus TaxID=6832 RepID=UPI0027D9E1ED|nr:uncharacterized protein LOC131886882 [Tigriopus californicus]
MGLNDKGAPGKNIGILWFTDGSKTNNGVGWGYHIVCENDSDPLQGHGKLGDDNSVFQAEVFAITNAARSLLASSTEAHKIIDFYIDSQAAIKAIGKISSISKVVEECINTLNSLGVNNMVMLHWIKAHVGHDLNEKVDALAKLGSTEGPYKQLPRPTTVHAIAFRDILMDKWQELWMKPDKTFNKLPFRQTRLWFENVDNKYSKDFLKLDRSILSKLIQAISGHSYLNYHQYKIGRTSTELCRFCKAANEESHHIVAVCPALSSQRQRALHTTGFDIPMDLPSLLRFLREPTIGRLFSSEGVEQTDHVSDSFQNF